MTVIERYSLSPCSHPLVDSASGQPWPAITVPLSGIHSPGRKTSGHPVVTAGHRQRHDVSAGLDSTELGCPCYARFVALSIHSFSCTASGVIDRQMLGLGSYLHSIANVFTFDLTTGLRCDILAPRGSADRRLARCAVHWRMPARPFAAEIRGSAGYKERTGLKRGQLG
jgi:hypothetical protein